MTGLAHPSGRPGPLPYLLTQPSCLEHAITLPTYVSTYLPCMYVGSMVLEREGKRVATEAHQRLILILLLLLLLLLPLPLLLLLLLPPAFPASAHPTHPLHILYTFSGISEADGRSIAEARPMTLA